MLAVHSRGRRRSIVEKEIESRDTVSNIQAGIAVELHGIQAPRGGAAEAEGEENPRPTSGASALWQGKTPLRRQRAAGGGRKAGHEEQSRNHVDIYDADTFIATLPVLPLGQGFLPLRALLLGRHDLERGQVVGRGRRAGRSIGLCPALLRDLGPAAGAGAGAGVRVGRAVGAAGRGGGLEDAALGLLAAAQKGLGKVARVDGGADAVHRLGHNVELVGEGEEVGDEFFR